MLAERIPVSWPPMGQAAADPAAAFAECGAAALGRVLDDDELAVARAAFDAVVPAHGVTGEYARIVHDGWRKSAAMQALIPRLGELACEVVDVPALVLFHDHWLVKPPGGDAMTWHQDYSYLPVDRADGLTLWVALDDVTPENGCLYYVFGSHQLGERRAAWGMMGDDDPRAALEPIAVGDHERGVPAPTAAGCAIAHHTYLWHRAPRNDSRAPRRTWAMSFVVPEARWHPEHSPHPRSAVSPRVQGQALEDDLLRVQRRPAS